MHTDTSPTAVGDRMRPLNRRILRKHLIVDGVVAGVAVVIASLVTAFVFWAAKRLHRWLPETDVHIDGHAFSIDSLPEAVTSNGRTVAILFVGVIATGALILTACVHGCLGAATVRTYLGAGLTRREFFGMHIRASLSNTAAVASFGLAAVLLQAAVAGDASGRLTLTHTEQTAARGSSSSPRLRPRWGPIGWASPSRPCSSASPGTFPPRDCSPSPWSRGSSGCSATAPMTRQSPSHPTRCG